MGLPMGGRGPRFSAATDLLDPLAAQVVVLEDEKGSRIAWISIDLVGMDRQVTSRLRLELAGLTGIPVEAIVVNFSHTHSGPMTGFEGYATLVEKPAELHAYEEGLLTATARMVLEAAENLQPVTVTVHRGASQIGINRRGRNPDGSVGLRPNPDGFFNKDLWVMDLQAGDARGVLFSYGCHPVMVYGHAWNSISADYPGACRDRLAEALGPHAHVQFIQGCAGNVRPRRLADCEAGSFRTATPEDHLCTGRELAEDVLAAIGAGGNRLELELRCASGFALAPRDMEALPPVSHWKELARSDEELERNIGEYWGERLHLGIPYQRFLPWEVGLIRLGQGNTIAWLAHEAFAEWLPLLRDWLDDPELIAWGYCQDGRNYLPPDDIIPQGGYEIVTANAYTKAGPGPLRPGIDEAVRKTFTSMAERL